MSCTQEMSGSYILPSKVVNAVRQDFIRYLIDYHRSNFDRRVRLAKALRAKPAAFFKDPSSAFRLALRTSGSDHLIDDLRAVLGMFDVSRVVTAEYTRLGWNERITDGTLTITKSMIQMPKAKDLPKIKMSERSFGHEVLGETRGDFGMAFVGRELRVGVDRGNNTVRDLEDNPHFHKLLELLGKVKWTRGTGGHLNYSDEYAEEAQREHGGITMGDMRHTFGPLAQQENQARTRAMMAYMR